MIHSPSIHQLIARLEQSVSLWEGVSAENHKMGGREFLWNHLEIGHIHADGNMDILFTKKIRDVLFENHLIQTHKWVPKSGWATFCLRKERNLEMAINLLMLSYLHKRRRKAKDLQEKMDIDLRINQLPYSLAIITAAKL
jgi:hypothetical protein